ncbi:MAG: hypothetical protein ABSD56_11655 [Bryobacteraceae bacterium]|jgi:hypothetical protein
MNRPSNDRLLRELLAADEAPDLRRLSLERGLAGLRRRRQQRHFRHVILCVGLPVALVAGVLLQHLFTSAQPPRLAMAPATVSAPPEQTAAPPVKIITEAELLALFPNRPVALIGKPGEQRLLVFSRGVSP